ncbi:MAG: phytanoyl-CoA dioxygenase family protein [Gammaproteobacteria bacterium]|nr:phytanoyl-CoA dioxygenase family protein [Gammaproteobacteria bacterium]
MLTDDEIHHYHDHGYVIPDFRLDDESLADIRGSHARLLAKHPEFNDYCPAVLAFDTGFLNIARIPPILDMVEQLIGPDFALWNSSFFAKPARVGTKTPWHQDGEYWPIRPLATCSVWIAVDAATPENGCLRVIPGSHRRRELGKHDFNDGAGLSLPLEIQADEFDEDTARDIVLDVGQVSLHDIYLIHGSEPNRSDTPRRGMTLRYMATTSRYCRELADSRRGGPLSMSERTLYLMRGEDRSGANDFRIRH